MYRDIRVLASVVHVLCVSLDRDYADVSRILLDVKKKLANCSVELRKSPEEIASSSAPWPPCRGVRSESSSIFETQAHRELVIVRSVPLIVPERSTSRCVNVARRRTRV